MRTNALGDLAEVQRQRGGRAQQTNNQILELVNYHLNQRRRLVLVELIRAERVEATLRLGLGQTLHGERMKM